jgi:DnaK suppressor protein
MESNDMNMEKLKKTLLDMRNDILADVNQTSDSSKNMGSDGVQDIGDVSSNTYNRQILLRLNDGQRLRMKDIDDALDRVKDGEYGLCIDCGEPINMKRLEVRPQARYCVDCKTDLENGKKAS